MGSVFQASRRTAVLPILALLLLPARLAHAEINGADSLEWMVADADCVVVGRLVECAEGRDKDHHPWWQATVAVSGTLKGEPAASITFSLLQPLGKPGRADPGEGEKLYFLVRSARGTEDWQAGLRRHPFTLRSDERHGILGGGAHVAYTMDCRVLSDFGAICTAARAAAAFRTGETSPSGSANRARFGMDRWLSRAGGSMTISPPWDSAAHQALFNRSAVFLVLPLDERTEALALRWAEVPDRRYHALTILTRCRSDDSIRLLRTFLDEPGWSYGGGAPPGRALSWDYPARRSAYVALVDLSASVPTPVMEGPEEFFRPVPASAAVGVAAVVGLTAGLALLALARRPGAARGLKWVVATLLLGAAAVLSYARWGDGDRVRELTFSTPGGTRAWLTLSSRELAVTRIASWPRWAAPSVARFERSECPGDVWGDGGVKVAGSALWRGFGQTAGTIKFVPERTNPSPPPPPTTQHDFRRWYLPVTPLVYAAAAYPVWLVATTAVGVMRRRRRRKRVQCIGCGYDLRMSPGRCPECGMIPANPHASAAVADRSRVISAPS